MRKFFLAMWMIAGLAYISYASCIQGDCYDGTGSWRYASGAVYEGQFFHGKRHGKGVIRFSNGTRYKGDFNRDFRQGQGRQDFAEGGYYEGGFFRDRFHGHGTMLFPDGMRYKGTWASGEMEGEGELVYTDGRTYNGQFIKGRFQGKGKFTYPNGDQYSGEWLAGKRNGAGVLVQVNGKQIQGRWADDKPIPQLTRPSNAPASLLTSEFRYSDGSRYVGTLSPEGVPEGYGTIYYADGDSYEGGWKGHAPNGQGTLTRKDGRRISGVWSLGELLELHDDLRPLPENKVKPVRDAKVRTWAVVVGVAQYHTLQKLEYPDDDAYQMVGFLRSPEGGAIPESQIRLLINEEATRDQIIHSLQEMFGSADENDVVLFYFSGHGLDGSILPSDFDGWDEQLYYKELMSIMDASLARQKLVIADACHAGSMVSSQNSLKEAPYKSMGLNEMGGSTALLLSSQPAEFSLEDSRLKAGIFSYYLRKGLQGAADADHDRTIRLGELYNYVHKEVRTYSKGKQTPILQGVFDHKMQVALLRPQG